MAAIEVPAHDSSLESVTILRRLKAIPLLVFVLIVTALSLGDRAPASAHARVGTVRIVGSRVEHRLGVDLVSRSDIPFAFDKVGHFALYFVAGVLAWLGLGKRYGAGAITLYLIGFSAVIEVAQPLLSYSRQAELSDLVANSVGVGFGVAAAVILTRALELIWRRIPGL